MTKEESKSNINLPIKKTTGETLEERMSENAYQRILPARYQMKDEQGELIEDQEDVFERVAKNLSLADIYYESERLEKTIKIKPKHIKETHSDTSKLVKKVYGEKLSLEEAKEKELEVELTEKNVKHLSYDNLVEDIPKEIKEHAKNVKEKFKENMEYLKTIPNTPALMNAGGELQQLSACFVLSPEDDMEDIHDKAKQAAKVFQSGGGCGYGFWQLRPKGDKVGSTGGVSSGPISFMRTYDQMCSTVAQGGSRRGAQMGVMRVSHPDVLEFIHSKDKDISLAHTLKLNDPDDYTHNDFIEAVKEARELINDEGKVPKHLRNAVEGHLSNFNISVGITDGFMEAVKNNDTYTFTNPRTGEPFKANEKTVETYEMFGLGDYVEEGKILEVPANIIWEHIIESAHENGEPGVVYLERMNKELAFDVDKHPEKLVKSTNPCGEQELFDYDCCNLKHINLSTIIDEDCDIQNYKEFKNNLSKEKSEEDIIDNYLENVIDWEDFNQRIKWATRFLDNAITMSDFPVEKISETTGDVRKIGLGVMGYAQLLVQMGVRYGSEEGNEIARKLMNYINNESIEYSQELSISDKPGMDRGVFNEWSKSKWSNPKEYSDWFHREYTRLEETPDEFPVRNHSHTTIAPTGCVLEGTTVSTPEGLVKIDDFVDKGSDGKWNSISEDVCSDDGVVSATNGFDNGKSKIRRITTEKGFEVSSTEDHKFRVINNDGEYVWKRADEIDINDSLVIRKNTTKVKDSNVELDASEKDNFNTNTDNDLILPEKLTPKLSEFLGFYVGNGYVHDEVGVKIAVDNEKDELFESIMTLSRDVFGVTPTVENKGHVKIICVGGKHIIRYFKDNSWIKQKGNNGEGSANARVPSQIMRGGSSNIKSFLRGFVEADDTAHRKVEMFSSSEDLLKDIQDMLLSIGIIFKREKKQMSKETMDKRFGNRDMYVLRGLNKNEDKKFVDDVGLVTKSLDLDVNVNSYEGDDYPGSLIGELRDMDGYYEVNDSLRSCLDNARNIGHISKITLERFFENEKVKVDEDSLVYKLYSDFFVDKVSGVEKDTGHTLDLEVPDNRTYIANGFVSHNTTGMVGNTTGGCEPIYQVAYYKNVTSDIQGEEMLVEFDDLFIRTLKENNIDVEKVKKECKNLMKNNNFSGISDINSVPEELGELFVTTGDISTLEHGGVQCAFQEGVSSSISKTINAPNNASVEDAMEAFEYIYDNGGKGVTYYRDGTRSKQVLTTRRDNKKFAELDDEELLDVIRDRIGADSNGFVGSLVDLVVEVAEGEDERVLESVFEEFDGGDVDVSEGTEDSHITMKLSEYRKRPDVLVGATRRKDVPTGDTLYVTLNEDKDSGLFEVFAEVGKSGGRISSLTEGLCRMISLLLRYGCPPDKIVKHLSDIKGPEVVWDNNGNRIHSIPDALSVAIEEHLDEGGAVGRIKENQNLDNAKELDQKAEREMTIDLEDCPDCDGEVIRSEGCVKCQECGWSKC